MPLIDCLNKPVRGEPFHLQHTPGRVWAQTRRDGLYKIKKQLKKETNNTCMIFSQKKFPDQKFRQKYMYI